MMNNLLRGRRSYTSVMERVGVLGGTFDPVHVGHVVAAVDTRAALKLDRMLMVVAGDPWQKREDVVAPAKDRLELVAAAVEDIDGVEASAIEIARVQHTWPQVPASPMPITNGQSPAAGQLQNGSAVASDIGVSSSTM